MFIHNEIEVTDAIDAGTPVFFRQIGGITWMRMLQKAVVNFDLFEYWLGSDHPILPASVDPDYPMDMRPKLREVFAAARSRTEELRRAAFTSAPAHSTDQLYRTGIAALERRNAELVDTLEALVSLHDCGALAANARCARVKCGRFVMHECY